MGLTCQRRRICYAVSPLPPPRRARGDVVMRGISRTSRMVRWCAHTSAYPVVGAPERRLAKTPLERHLGRRGARVRTAAKADARPHGRTTPATPATASPRDTSRRNGAEPSAGAVVDFAAIEHRAQRCVARRAVRGGGSGPGAVCVWRIDRLVVGGRRRLTVPAFNAPNIEAARPARCAGSPRRRHHHRAAPVNVTVVYCIPP